MNEPNDASHDDELRQLRARAASGDPEGCYLLAQRLVAGEEVEEAFRLFERASDANHKRALVDKSRMQLYGIGTHQDIAAGVAGLERAEAAGNAIAAYMLALVAVGNVGVARDGRINTRVMRAADAGFPPAMLAAAIHFGRRPDPRDQATCVRLLGDAAARGDATAALLLRERLRDDPSPRPAEAMTGKASAPAPLPRCSAPVPVQKQAATGRLLLEETWRQPPARRLCERPLIAVFDGLLSRDECRLLMASARPRLSHSHTLDPTAGAKTFSSIRTSSDASFDTLHEDLALRLVQARVATAAGVELAHAEQLIVLRYMPGEEYRPHRDFLPPTAIASNNPAAGDRAGTICVYLNDVEAGGDTDFPAAGVRIAPRAGSAVAFRNLLPDGTPDADSVHAGMPVERGEKWLATLWIRERRYRPF